MNKSDLGDQSFEGKTQQDPQQIQDHVFDDDPVPVEHFLKPTLANFDRPSQLKTEGKKIHEKAKSQQIEKSECYVPTQYCIDAPYIEVIK